MHYRFYPELDSTNEEAKRLYYAKSYPVIPLTIIADQQTKGKGSHGKSWYSENQGGLYYTLILSPENFIHENTASYIYQAALIVGQIIYRTISLSPTIKRPNDLLLNGKKICGILMETVGNKPEYVIIGVGLNINQTKFPYELQNMATSLKIETQKTYSKDTVIQDLSKELIHVFKRH